jgi:hypothetical protein
MRRPISVSVGASLATALVTGAAWSQGTPKTCSEAHSACIAQTKLSKECEDERQWCLKTGTFAHPKTKAVWSGLQKR